MIRQSKASFKVPIWKGQTAERALQLSKTMFETHNGCIQNTPPDENILYNLTDKDILATHVMPNDVQVINATDKSTTKRDTNLERQLSNMYYKPSTFYSTLGKEPDNMQKILPATDTNSKVSISKTFILMVFATYY